MSKEQQNSPSADVPEAEEPPEPRGGGDVSGKGSKPTTGGTSPSDRDYGGIAIDPPDNTGGGGSDW